MNAGVEVVQGQAVRHCQGSADGVEGIVEAFAGLHEVGVVHV